MDGELWIARQAFEDVASTVLDAVPDDAAWRKIQYHVFELPDAAGDFTVRQSQIKSIVKQADVSWLRAVHQFRVHTTEEFEQALQDVVAHGGEA